MQIIVHSRLSFYHLRCNIWKQILVHLDRPITANIAFSRSFIAHDLIERA